MVKRDEIGFQILVLGLIFTISAYGFSFILTTTTDFCIVDGIRDSVNITKLENCISKTSTFNIITYYVGFSGMILLALASGLLSKLKFKKLHFSSFNMNLGSNPKRQLALGGRLMFGFLFIIVGISLLASGFLNLNYYDAVKEDTTSRTIETRSLDSHPELPWLLSYDVNLEPSHSIYLQADEKIRMHFHVISEQVMQNFEIHIFHEDLFETYSNLLDSYINENTSVPKLKNEWISNAVFEIHDDTKCDVINDDVINDDGTITRNSDCHFDYNAQNSHIFVNSGRYHLMFITTLENGTQTGYIEKASMFSLKDPFTVELSNQMEEVVSLTEAQQKLNFKAEGLSLIGIGVAMLIGAIATFDSFVNTKRQYAIEDKEEEKRIYVEKMLVTALARIRETGREINQIMLQANSVTPQVIERWEIFRVPAERLDTLIMMGADVVNHEILDDIDLIRGSIINNPSSAVTGLADQLGQLETRINDLLSTRLNSSRELILNESLAHNQRLRDRHLSPDSTSQNQDLIRAELDNNERRIQNLYRV